MSRPDGTPGRKRLSQSDRRLILMIVCGLAFYAFSSWISRNLDRAVAAEKAADAAHRHKANPWAKD